MNDDIASAATGILVIAITAVIFIFFAILFLLGVKVVRKLLGMQSDDGDVEPDARPLPPTRMFGAPPGDQWRNAFDYWLYKLEDLTGIEFTTSPERLMAGSLIITVGAALVASMPLMVIAPSDGAGFAMGMLGTSVVVGLVMGNKLSQPAAGWFENRNSVGLTAPRENDGIIIGEEDW
jgi:hypothetical protein